MVSIKLNLGLSYRKIHELRTQHEKAKPKREEEHKINVYYVHHLSAYRTQHCTSTRGRVE
jgi:uracil-DNA glycosylase